MATPFPVNRFIQAGVGAAQIATLQAAWNLLADPVKDAEARIIAGMDSVDLAGLASFPASGGGFTPSVSPSGQVITINTGGGSLATGAAVAGATASALLQTDGSGNLQSGPLTASVGSGNSRTVTSAASITTADQTLIGNPASGLIQTTLPDATTSVGKPYSVKNNGATYGAGRLVQLVPVSSQTIDGKTSLVLPSNAAATLVADGVNWRTTHSPSLTGVPLPLWYDDVQRANTAGGTIGNAPLSGLASSGAYTLTGAGASTIQITANQIVSASGVTYITPTSGNLTAVAETIVCRFSAPGSGPNWAMAFTTLTGAVTVPGINMVHLNWSLTQANLSLWIGGTTSVTTDGTTGVLTGVSSTVINQLTTSGTTNFQGTNINGSPTVTAVNSGGGTVTLSNNTTGAGTQNATWSVNSITLQSQTSTYVAATAFSQSHEYEMRLTIPAGTNFAHLEVIDTTNGAVMLAADFYDSRLQSCMGTQVFWEPAANSNMTGLHAYPSAPVFVPNQINAQAGINGPIGMGYQSAGYFSKTIIGMLNSNSTAKTPTGATLDVFSSLASGVSMATFSNDQAGGAYININSTLAGSPAGLIVTTPTTNAQWKLGLLGGSSTLNIACTAASSGSLQVTPAGNLTMTNAAADGIMTITSSFAGANAVLRLTANGGTYASIKQTNATSDMELQTNGGTTRLTISSAGLFTVWDGGNLVLGTTTGTKIGTATTQKLGFFNATPIVQPNTTGTTTGFTAATGTAVLAGSTFTGNTGATAYTIGDIVNALKTLGLIAA